MVLGIWFLAHGFGVMGLGLWVWAYGFGPMVLGIWVGSMILGAQPCKGEQAKLKSISLY